MRVHGMVLALACFFIDLVFFMIFKSWVVFTLVAMWLFQSVRHKKTLSIFYQLSFIMLLFLQDFIRHGRFGLIALFVVPLYLALPYMRHFFVHASVAILVMGVSLFVLYDQVLLVFLLNNVWPSLFVTSMKISVTVISGYIGGIGMLGNRFFFLSGKKRRKVWTPNR